MAGGSAVRAIPHEEIRADESEDWRRISAASATSRTIRCCHSSVSSTSEPLTAARAGLKVTTFLVAESGYNPYTTVLVTTREHLKQNPDEVKRMVAAVRAGWEAILKDPTRANATMGAINKAMDAQTFTGQRAAQAPLIQTSDIKQLGEMTQARWRTLVDQLTQLKSIKGPVNPQDLFIDR